MATFNTLILTISIFCVIETSAWTFSNLLMSGTSATLGYADTIAIGAQKGLDECREQFTWDKWNCPQGIFTQMFSKNKLPANREIGFVHAIISAGIVHTVTKNCTMGQLENCRCDRRKVDRSIVSADGESSSKHNFRWGGCSDSSEFAESLARTFLDEREVGHDPRAIINLHNNQVGRMAVRNTMVKICKCHGISGSCTTKTCWMRISDFRTVGNYLKNAYRKAMKVDTNADRDGNSLGRVRKGIAEISSESRTARIAVNDDSEVGGHSSRATFSLDGHSSEDSANKGHGDDLTGLVTKSRLAFAEDSPDYCSLNTTLGSNGTLGRHCSRRKGEDVKVEERKSCRKLCRQCGFKVKKVRRRVLSSCNCKFKWCCEVQCETCAKEELTFTCSL